MRLLLKIAATMLLGCALGLGLTALIVARGPLFGAVRAGPWIGFPRAGDAGDPYARAAYARSAEIPLGSGEGLSFSARTDDADTPLRRRCTYRLSAGTMPARAWTMTVLAPDGTPDDGTIRREITSAEILRTADGRFDLAVGPEARPGNWLPVSDGAGDFVLMFRLYDTVLSTAGSLDAGLMPAIALESCA